MDRFSDTKLILQLSDVRSDKLIHSRNNLDEKIGSLSQLNTTTDVPP